MGIEITNIQISVQDPKKVDYEGLSDDQFYLHKLSQPGTLLSKMVALVHLINLENKKIEGIIEEIQKKSQPIQRQQSSSVTISLPPRIDTTILSSLEFSLLLMQFTYVEALSNIIGECALRNNRSTQKLTSFEQDYLLEIETRYKDGKTKVKKAFVPTEEKAKEYIKLYAKSHNEEYHLNVSATSYWKEFLNAKNIRNEITHPKSGVTSSINPTHLFEMSRFIYWFTEEIYSLFDKYAPTNYYPMIESWSYGALELLFKIQKNKDYNITKETSKHNQIKKERVR
jgi:hypothetical protein